MPLIAAMIVRRAGRRTLGAAAIVALDVDDQRVVELAQVLDLLDHAADLMVGVGEIGGKYLRLAGEQLLLVGVSVSHFGRIVRPWRQFGPPG